MHAQVCAPQGQGCPTFKVPPLDGRFCVPELFEYNALYSPGHPYFVFSSASGQMITITYRDFWKQVGTAAARVLRHTVPLDELYAAQNREPERGPTIGILAVADTISYCILMTAIMRLGYVPFPISPRNSPAAVASLMQQMNVIQLFVSQDAAMQRLGRDSIDLLKPMNIAVDILPLITVDPSALEVKAADGTVKGDSITFPKLDLDRVLCVYHSSGSASFPRPVPFTNRAFLRLSMVPFFGEVDLCGTVVGVHAAPVFHAMGLSSLAWPPTSGMIAAVYRPAVPPVVPTPQNYLDGIISTNSTILLCVPSFVEAWFHDKTSVKALKHLRAINFAGAPMSKEVGDQLIRMGIALFPSYGMTETGSISRFLPSARPAIDDWEYFTISPHIIIELLPQEDRSDIVEVAVVHTRQFKPNVINHRLSDGREAYRTGDLLERHPTHVGLWRVFGRADDQIALITGEKTNPVPLEAILTRNACVAGALVFGESRPYNGVLIEPRPEYSLHLQDSTYVLDQIWPSVEDMNYHAPAHSRVIKEMVRIADPSKPFQYTAKGTVRRETVLKLYAEEIDALYCRERHWHADTSLQMPWGNADGKDFVRSVVADVLGRRIDDEDNLFEQGCDSLQATYIRQIITRGYVQANDFPSSTLPQDLVYLHPSIRSITEFMANTKNFVIAVDDSAEKAAEMEAMLAEYTTPLHRYSSVMEDTTLSEEVVLVTGTSGRLGSHFLAALLSSPSVAKVYALNRHGYESIGVRQRRSFELCGLPVEQLTSAKLSLLEAKLEEEYLQLNPSIYKEMRRFVTCVVHMAWLVNFNLPLSTYDTLIKGVSDLINFCLASMRPTPPQFLFTSSISVFTDAATHAHPEEPITDPKLSLGRGYGESKWVTEQLLLQASRQGLKANIVRLGQLCGDTHKGAWNEKEWVPAILRGSQMLGGIPQSDEVISWLPLDVAASSLLEILCESKHGGIYHLVHPRPVHWSVFSDAASNLLELPVIPWELWLSRLRTASDTLPSGANGLRNRNPAVALVKHFTDYRGAPVLQTEKCQAISTSLRNARALEAADVEKWIGNWREIGFLKEH